MANNPVCCSTEYNTTTCRRNECGDDCATQFGYGGSCCGNYGERGCGCGCEREGSRSSRRGDEDEDESRFASRENERSNRWQVAMAYVPWQSFDSIYAPEDALESGTMFPELKLPFLGGGRR